MLAISTRTNARIATLLFIALLLFTYRFPTAAKTVDSPRIGQIELADVEPLPNFDIRWRQSGRARTINLAERKRALAVEPAALNSVVLRWDDQMDLPHHLLSFGDPLTRPSVDDAVTIAKRFVRNNRSLFQVSDDQLNAARVSARSTDEQAGLTRLALEQRANGIRVFDSDMLFILDRQGRVISESGGFIPEIESHTLDRTPGLTAEQALRHAALACGARLTAPVSSMLAPVPARERVVFSSDEVDGRSEASLVYYPVTREDVRLAYQVLLYDVPTPIDSYLVLVDAATGELLRRDSLTHALNPSGRVFTKENPVVSGTREMVPFVGDATASPNGWVKGTRTEGNNAQVYYNPEAQNRGGEIVEVNGDGLFDFPLDLTAGRSPLEYYKASAANLFYWVNFSHDRFHALGFNETSRNFQEDNFGRGGRAGDPVRAETLRGAKLDPAQGLVRNNAFFATSLEGTQPLLAMLLWVVNANGQTLELDSSYDAGVIIHEYTHGVSTRLAGTDNSIGLRSTQGGGMGEGWSDFFAMSFLTSGDLPLSDPVSTGSYVTQLARGVRSYPYTTRFETNPLTFGDIQFNSAVHAQGTVWCNMLWEMRQALIERYGFEAGRQKAERLVIDGLKLTPIAPLFTDARDAILLADRATNGGANQDLIWRAFARRGLGASATTSIAAGSTGFRINAKEAYDVPAENSAGSLVINDKPPAPAVLFESLPIVVVDRDLISSQLVDVQARNLRTGATVTLTLTESSPGRFAGELRVLPPEADGGPASILVAQPGDEVLITYANARDGSGAAETIEARTVVGRRITVYALNFEEGAPGWTLQGLWHLTERRAASPTRSLYFAQKKGANEGKSFTPAGRSGPALSPEIDLRGLLRPLLEFDYYFSGALIGDQTNPAGDIMNLFARNYPFVGPITIPTEDPRLPVTFDVRPNAENAFRQARIDLRFIENRGAYLNFNFSSSLADLKRKKLEGFYVDNIRLTAVSTR